MSTICSLLLMCCIEIKPRNNLSITKWQLISICFVHSWYIGLDEMCNAALLSQKTIPSCSCLIFNSLINPLIQIISDTVFLILLYSDSAEDFEIVFCLLTFHDFNDLPILIHKLVIDFLVPWHPAQLESQ